VPVILAICAPVLFSATDRLSKVMSVGARFAISNEITAVLDETDEYSRDAVTLSLKAAAAAPYTASDSNVGLSCN